MKIACPCGKEIIVGSNRKKYCCKKCFYAYRIRPKGLVYVLKTENKRWFRKDNKPWNAGIKLPFQVWNKGIGNGYINYRGYKVLCINGEEILEHRKIIEDYVGRKLDPIY